MLKCWCDVWKYLRSGVKFDKHHLFWEQWFLKSDLLMLLGPFFDNLCYCFGKTIYPAHLTFNTSRYIVYRNLISDHPWEYSQLSKVMWKRTKTNSEYIHFHLRFVSDDSRTPLWGCQLYEWRQETNMAEIKMAEDNMAELIQNFNIANVAFKFCRKTFDSAFLFK